MKGLLTPGAPFYNNLYIWMAKIQKVKFEGDVAEAESKK